MDEDNVQEKENVLQPQPQGSAWTACSSSETNGEEIPKKELASSYKRICFIGDLINNKELRLTAESFGLPIVSSVTGDEYIEEESAATLFVIEQFEGPVFTSLWKRKQPIVGTVALRQLCENKQALPNHRTRPLFNLSMTRIVVCLTGFRNKDELSELVPLIHHMGGSIRRDMSTKVTHLIANMCGGNRYQYAIGFSLPVLNPQWVKECWNRRHEMHFCALTDSKFMSEHKAKPFHGLNVCFVGFPEDETNHMTEVLHANGGCLTNIDDANCTHVVVDESSVAEKPSGTPKSWVVKAEWFWTSVQKQITQDEKEYLFDDYIEQVLSPSNRRDSLATTSSSKRKRKIRETLQSLVRQDSPSLSKRRSSVSDAGRLSVSGSFLDATASPDKFLKDSEFSIETPRKGFTPRRQVFLELVETESNYVGILETIITMFKKHLEQMPEEEALLNNTEHNLIFGKIDPIYEVHVKMLKELKRIDASWTEDKCIGSIIVSFASELQKAYPSFINYYEEMKEVLTQCDQTKPRFHAFLKAMQTRPECGRQSLQELMIRPVQRLGSISLLLNDIVKHTQRTNPDFAALEKAKESLTEIMTHINEDKRKTEGQVTLFNIFNEIDNCPPDIVSSHRSFIAKSEVMQLTSTDDLPSKGSNLVLFLFSDQLEICKKKSKAFNSLKSPSNASQNRTSIKPYKHVKLVALNVIKRVVNIKDTEDCQRVFGLVCSSNEDSKQRLYAFVMTDEESDKTAFLKTLTKQMATNACTADADKFLAYLEPHELDMDTKDLSNGMLSQAKKFATRTKTKVSRAFSFNKTPGKLKRVVSSMISPIGSSTNVTPSSQLAQMRLASYNNIHELGNADNASEAPPAAPLSVQPTRKVKSSSFTVNSLNRL